MTDQNITENEALRTVVMVATRNLRRDSIGDADILDIADTMEQALRDHALDSISLHRENRPRPTQSLTGLHMPPEGV